MGVLERKVTMPPTRPIRPDLHADFQTPDLDLRPGALDALKNASMPDFLFQLAPAFEDAALLGFDDPGPLVEDALRQLGVAIDPEAEVLSVPGGTPVDPASLAGLSLPLIALALANAKRRQSIGIYVTPSRNDGERALRKLALAEADLGVAERLVSAEPVVPFAIRVPYHGVEAAVRAPLARTNFRLSHEGAPCSCGLIQVDSVKVSRVAIFLAGGGGGGAPPGSSSTPGTPTNTVRTLVGCSLAGVDAETAFDLDLQETLVRKALGSVHKVTVTKDVDLRVRQLVGNNVVDKQAELAQGNLLQKLLAQLMRPAVAVSKDVRNLLGRIGTNLLEDFPDGPFGILAAALVADILIPLGLDPNQPPPVPVPIAKKLQLDVDTLRVLDDRVDIIGSGRLVDRHPRAFATAVIRKQGTTTQVRATAGLFDMRNTNANDIAWTSSTGTFVGPATGNTVTVSYDGNEALSLGFTAHDADLQVASVNGVVKSVAGLPLGILGL